jgi:hypothetical protein
LLLKKTGEIQGREFFFYILFYGGGSELEIELIENGTF